MKGLPSTSSGSDSGMGLSPSSSRLSRSGPKTTSLDVPRGKGKSKDLQKHGGPGPCANEKEDVSSTDYTDTDSGTNSGDDSDYENLDYVRRLVRRSVRAKHGDADFDEEAYLKAIHGEKIKVLPVTPGGGIPEGWILILGI